jgi:hypothetical protein
MTLDHIEELLLTICEPSEGFEEVEEMVKGSYHTRRHKEAHEERQRLDKEAQAFERALEAAAVVVPEQIKLAWRKMRDAITATPTRSVS